MMLVAVMLMHDDGVCSVDDGCPEGQCDTDGRDDDAHEGKAPDEHDFWRCEW